MLDASDKSEENFWKPQAQIAKGKDHDIPFFMSLIFGSWFQSLENSIGSMFIGMIVEGILIIMSFMLLDLFETLL